MPHKIKDLRRKRFGRLVAIKRIYKNKESYWLCLCDCGKETVVRRTHLLEGSTVSCGCYAAEATSKRSWKGFGEISGKYWYDLVRNAKYRGMKVGIEIKEAWQKFLDQGKKCALTGESLAFCKGKKDRKDQTASLDRWDNTKGYTFENCCWIHKRVNRLKNDFSVQELLHWCRKIIEHNDDRA